MNVAVIPFDMAAAGDGGGLRRALRRLRLADVLQLAIVAKIEGTATLNDVSRQLAAERLGAELRRAGGASLVRRSLQILSVGCEGVITPGGWVLASLKGAASGGFGLALGHAHSAPVPMRDRATSRHIDAAAAAVRSATRRAGLDARTVELVLIKSPIRLAGAGPHVGSTAASRGAAALGAALALGEIRRADLREDSLCADWRLHSSRTMAFSGTETDRCEAVVMGNRRGGDPGLLVERAVLADILDRRSLEPLGAGALQAVFYKAGVAPGGELRGARTTIETSELPPDKQLRAAASGVVGAVLGTTRAFISGGAEHQAPPGSCIAAVIRAAN